MNLKQRAKKMKTDIPAIFLSLKSKDTPLAAKIMAGITVGYALSPIDLIPDFIPVIGYLDDIIILPTAIWLTVRLIPQEILTELRNEASLRLAQRPLSALAVGTIVTIWFGIALMTGWLLWRW